MLSLCDSLPRVTNLAVDAYHFPKPTTKPDPDQGDHREVSAEALENRRFWVQCFQRQLGSSLPELFQVRFKPNSAELGG